LTIASSRPCTVNVTLSSDDASWTVRYGVEANDHVLPLLGLRPDRTYDVEVSLVGADGETLSVDVDPIDVAPLHSSFPTLEVRVDARASRQPGPTLLSLRNAGRQNDEPIGYFVIVDEDAEPIWAYEPEYITSDVSQLSGGGILAMVETPDGGAIVELSMLGRQRQRFGHETSGRGIAVPGVLDFHHEAEPLENGHILALNRQPVWVEDYPSSYSNPEPRQDTWVAADVVVEFDGEGTVHRTWPIAPHLDLTRVGYDSLGSSDLTDALDWSHANGVVRTTEGDLILSLRHQDALIKLSGSTGALMWILATPDNWPEPLQPYLLEADGPLDWPFHPHAPMVGPSGEVLVFDNGNNRTSPFVQGPVDDPREQYSRVVEYIVDEAAMTVRQSLAFLGPEGGSLFATHAGDADYLPNGNILSVFGALASQDGLWMEDHGLAQRSARVMEFVPGDANTVVWDLSIHRTAEQADRAWSCYRAERIAGLYAPELMVTVDEGAVASEDASL